MMDNYYKITYLSNDKIKEYTDFDKYDLDSACKAYKKLKDLNYWDVKLFNVITNELEIKDNQIPM